MTIISQDTAKYALRNLEHRKGRSFLTIISIFVGITAIFVFVSFGLGLQAYISEFTTQTSADKISIMPKGMGAPGLDDTFSLTENDLEAVERAAGVREVSGVYSKVAEVDQDGSKKFVFLMGYDPQKPLILELFGDIGIHKGRFLRSGDEGKVVLGFNYLVEDKIFKRSYDLNDKINIQGEDLVVVGFFEQVGNPQDDSNAYVINDYAEELYPNDTAGYNWVVARIELDNVDTTIENVEKKLRKSRNLEEGKEDFFVQSFQDMIESYSGALNSIVAFIILIALVSVLVSSINTANTMITSVLERIKEVGVIKSVGARNSEVLGIFLFESAFLGFVAGALGVGVGWLFSFMGGVFLNNAGWGFLSPIFPPSLFIGLILFSTITGAISGILPAIRASRIKPVDALRYE
tara:strand:+ start:14521 stop:15738 length:1218 start_codon:yes stop_codon:yes gene_type:complete